MPNNAQFFAVLGLAPTASAASIQKAYKQLALLHHPDKADAELQAEATARFQEINEAYKYCLSHLKQPTVEEQHEEDDTDWRGKLPAGIFNFNSEWWNNLRGNEPTPIINWAIACSKAHRFACVKLSEEEKYALNSEYNAAYAAFENWRRVHIERHDQEDRLQQNISGMHERLRRRAREDLATHRAQPGYTHTVYQDDIDEEAWDAVVTEGRPLPTNTWRDLHNSPLSATVGPQKRLALFRRQVAALEGRGGRQTKAQRARLRQTEARLVVEVEHEEKVKREAQIKKAAAKEARLQRRLGEVGRERMGVLGEVLVCGPLA